jgi:hypothetical protein
LRSEDSETESAGDPVLLIIKGKERENLNLRPDEESTGEMPEVRASDVPGFQSTVDLFGQAAVWTDPFNPGQDVLDSSTIFVPSQSGP